MVVDGNTFWERVESELAASDRTIKEISVSMDIPYSTIIDARRRKAYPRADIIYKIARFLGLPIDKLMGTSEESPLIARVNNIRKACLIASEEDLKLVERILRIDASRQPNRFAFTDTLKKMR